MKKNCVICGKEFEAEGKTIICSKPCSKLRKTELEKTRLADPEYREHINLLRQLRRIHDDTYRIKERDRKRLHIKLNPTIKKCVVCGNDFIAVRASTTCGKKCQEVRTAMRRHTADDLWNSRRREMNQLNPKMTNCVVCAKEFKANKSAKTCSKECGFINQRRKQTAFTKQYRTKTPRQLETRLAAAKRYYRRQVSKRRIIQFLAATTKQETT